MNKKIAIVIIISMFTNSQLHALRIITYWNHDTIPYTVSLHEIAENGFEDMFDLIKVKASDIVDCTYEETLNNLTKLVVIDPDGERRILKKPFSFIMAPNCTVHMYRDRIEICSTNALFRNKKNYPKIFVGLLKGAHNANKDTNDINYPH